MAKKVICSFEIHYPKYNTVQYKDLISHDDFVNDLKVKEGVCMELSKQMDELNSKKHKDEYQKLANEIKRIKSEIKEDYGDNYFTDNSPLWNSQFNNGKMILPHWQGGDIEVELIKIN